MKELISIIVPVYKVEQYLKRCVDSILAQTYLNYELILVDDGSPDRCGIICDEYVRLDKRIRVIHKQNGGLSDARNIGLSMASGEYIAFVDSDDWIATNYLETMLAALKTSHSDICECEVLRIIGNEKGDALVYDDYEVYETEQALEYLICDNVFHQHVWNKLYKRSCIADILFTVGKINEDEFWTYQVFGNAKKIVKINKALYYYFQRPESIMGVGYNLKRLDALEAKQRRQQYVEQKFPSLSAVANINLFNSCIYNGQMTLKYLKREQRKQAKQLIQIIQLQNHPKKEDMKILSEREKMWINMAKINFWMTCRIKNFLKKGF